MSDEPTATGAPGSSYPGSEPPGQEQRWQQPPEGTNPGTNPGGYPPPPDYWPGYQGGYPPAGQAPMGYVAPYPGPMAPSTSGWAIASLILSICGWTVLPFVAAIGGVVAGHIALHEISASQGRLQGHGFAVAGLVIGYAGIVLTVCAIVFFFGILAVALQGR